MTNIERENMLKIVGGKSELLTYVHQIYCFKESPLIFKFLIYHGLTGSILLDFIQTKCDGEPIKLISYCLKNIQKSNSAKNPTFI